MNCQWDKQWENRESLEIIAILQSNFIPFPSHLGLVILNLLQAFHVCCFHPVTTTRLRNFMRETRACNIWNRGKHLGLDGSMLNKVKFKGCVYLERVLNLLITFHLYSKIIHPTRCLLTNTSRGLLGSIFKIWLRLNKNKTKQGFLLSQVENLKRKIFCYSSFL